VKKPVALVLGPSRQALSGVTTHVNLLLESPLAEMFSLEHFQIGSEARAENAVGRLLRFVFSPLQLAWSIARNDAAILHVNTSLNKAYWRDLAYVAVAKLLGAAVVFQVHGGALPEQFMPTRAGRAFLRWTLRIPDVIVLLARVELEAYRRFVPEQTLAMLPNGIDCASYLRYSRPAVDPQAPLRLAYVGRLAAEKGLHETLDALQMLAQRGIPARLVIAGGGPEEPRLRARASQLGLKECVEFIGPVFGDEKARLLTRSDVLMLPSYAEGLPYALLEGMAAGAVPVATPVGAIPDVVVDGLHGFLVPARDPQAIAQALARVSADRATLVRMSAASRKRITGAYSIDRLAARLGEIYQELCPCAASQAG
jgi:glycosyltransferase involved in cell wall biosynthesis